MLRNVGLRKSVEQPVLDLNFAASQIGSNAAPDSRIDFSRGSNAYFVDTDGLVKKSPHNLAAQSEDLGNGWAFFNASASLNTAISPTGELTADKVVTDNSATLSTATKQVTGLDDSVDVAVSVYVKAAGQTVVNIQFYNKANTFHGSGDYDLTTGTRTSNPSAGTQSSIENVGNDWYRITFTGLNMGTGGTTPSFRAVCNQTGDGSKGFLVWGAQLSQHTTLPVGNPYIKTDSSAAYAARLDHDPSWFMSAAQEQNLLETTDLDDNTQYGLGRSTIAEQSSVENPFGGTDGVYLHLESAVGGSSYIYLFSGTNWQQYVTEGKQYTLSIYAKQFSGQKLELRSPNNDFRTARFNVDTGVIEDQDSLLDDVTIEDVGNGWFRCSITDTIATFSPTTWILAYLYNDLASPDYGLYYYGAQLEVGSTASTYHRTEGAPYYGEGATPKGLLIEEARTNLLTDSDVDSWFDGTRVTITTGAALAPDGTTTAEKVAKTAASFKYVTDGFTAASTGDFTASGYLKAGSLDEITILFSSDAAATINGRVIINLTNETSTDNASAALVSNTLTDVGNGWYRFTVTATFSNTTNPRIYVYPGVYNESVAGDIFVWGFQVEAGSFATSFIQTTGSTATRNADVATMGPTTGGTELVTNGTFDIDGDETGWQDNSIASTVSNGVVALTCSVQYGKFQQYKGGDGAFTGAKTLHEGRRYRATVDVTSYGSGQWQFALYDDTNAVTLGSSIFTSSGTKTFDCTMSDATNFRLWLTCISTGTHTASFDNVSVRELYPFEQYNPAEGTVVCEFERVGNTAFDYVWSFDDGTDEEAMSVLTLNDNSCYFGHRADDSNDLSFNNIGVVIGETNITAYAYQEDNYHISSATEGVLEKSFTDTSINVADSDRLGIGVRPRDEVAQGNCLIKRLTYYPYRLNDDVCDSKVTS